MYFHVRLASMLHQIQKKKKWVEFTEWRSWVYPFRLRSQRRRSLGREARPSLSLSFPHPQSPRGNVLAFPSQLGDIIPPSCPRSVSGHPARWACPKRLPGVVSGRHPCQMPYSLSIFSKISKTLTWPWRPPPHSVYNVSSRGCSVSHLKVSTQQSCCFKKVKTIYMFLCAKPASVRIYVFHYLYMYNIVCIIL